MSYNPNSFGFSIHFGEKYRYYYRRTRRIHLLNLDRKNKALWSLRDRHIPILLQWVAYKPPCFRREPFTKHRSCILCYIDNRIARFIEINMAWSQLKDHQYPIFYHHNHLLEYDHSLYIKIFDKYPMIFPYHSSKTLPHKPYVLGFDSLVPSSSLVSPPIS